MRGVKLIRCSPAGSSSLDGVELGRGMVVELGVVPNLKGFNLCLKVPIYDPLVS